MRKLGQLGPVPSGARIQAQAVWQDQCFQPSHLLLNLLLTFPRALPPSRWLVQGRPSQGWVCCPSNVTLDL